jgi:23S rRNA (uracil-5-)-methyltransferase RumA
MEDKKNLAIGDKLTLEIRKQGINGEGIGYYQKLAIFVPGAITQESVAVEIVDLKPGYALAKIDSILRQSTRRIVPPCPYYERCGACHMLHIAYPEQMKIKQSILKQSLRRYTSLETEALEIRRTLGMKSTFWYRNKSQMPFKNTPNGLTLGLYENNSNKFVTIDSCLVQEPLVNETNTKIVSILARRQVKAADSSNPDGILLNLITRYVSSTDALQVTFIVTRCNPVLKAIAEEILREIPRVKGVFCSVNKQHTVTMFGKSIDLLAGDPYVLERIGDLQIKLSPEAFHQLNTRQMAVLYEEILKACALEGHEVVIDAFCGVGISALQMARHAKMVFGIDISTSSIKDAIANAVLNGIKNVAFMADRVEKMLPELLSKARKPDIIVFDPPRSGLEEPVLDAVIQARIPKIIYVSCNPSTLAKNLDRLTRQYRIEYIQPIDMFPHTSSVESITVLRLAD